MLGIMVAAAMAFGSAQGQTKCNDDQGQNRCDEAVQKQMLARYRLQPIELQSNEILRRVFFVDGYGADTIALEFVRAPERSPVVKVYFPSEAGEPDIAPLEAPLTASKWSDVIDLSRDFDRDFTKVPEAKGGTDEVIVCLHGWVYWAESSDPGKESRSKVGRACDHPPMETFAWMAAKIAISAFPHCDLLVRSFARNDAKLLRGCSRLSGDKLAAAEVFNRAEGFRFIDRPGGIDDLGYFDLALDFQGTKMSGDKAKEFWAEQVAGKRSTNFYYTSIHGLSEDRVIVRGELVRDSDTNGIVYERADVTMEWVADGGLFNLKLVTVGPFQPFTLQSE